MVNHQIRKLGLSPIMMMMVGVKQVKLASPQLSSLSWSSSSSSSSSSLSLSWSSLSLSWSSSWSWSSSLSLSSSLWSSPSSPPSEVSEPTSRRTQLWPLLASASQSGSWSNPCSSPRNHDYNGEDQDHDVDQDQDDDDDDDNNDGLDLILADHICPRCDWHKNNEIDLFLLQLLNSQDMSSIETLFGKFPFEVQTLKMQVC